MRTCGTYAEIDNQPIIGLCSFLGMESFLVSKHVPTGTCFAYISLISQGLNIPKKLILSDLFPLDHRQVGTYAHQACSPSTINNNTFFTTTIQSYQLVFIPLSHFEVISIKSHVVWLVGILCKLMIRRWDSTKRKKAVRLYKPISRTYNFYVGDKHWLFSLCGSVGSKSAEKLENSLALRVPTCKSAFKPNACYSRLPVALGFYTS